MIGESSSARAIGAITDQQRDVAPIVWRVERRSGIPFAEGLRVAESLHVAILALCGRHFGVNAIPSVLSGRGADGCPLRGSRQHQHKHILIESDDAGAIGRLAIWAPAGFTEEERAAVAGARLRWAGRFVALSRVAEEAPRGFATARSWRSATPYLPFNHVKSQGKHSVEGQVRRELVDFRGLGEPATITAQSWARGHFGLVRGAGRRRGEPPPRPLELRMTFAQPVAGPIALGRYAHFSLGLMTPDDRSADG